MSTNEITALIQALAQRPPAPSHDFWTQLIPYLVMLLIAVVAWIKANTIESKHTETSKVVDKILVDVNSKSSQQVERSDELVDENKALSGKLAVYEERLRPPAAPPPSIHVANGGPITPVLAVPATLAGPHGPAVPDVPKAERTVTLTEEQFQALLARSTAQLPPS